MKNKTGNQKVATRDLLYTCPMDPDVVKDNPGRCPKCGMDLAMVEDHGEHGSHAAMEKDFQHRFFITLPFVIATMILSDNIQKWLGISLDFSYRVIVLFLLGTFIFFFGGIPFFKGARGELINRNFGMMTLVALAITVGYSFSVAATFIFPGESLYWEISTLISVFLLGHWLEMRAIRGTTGALAELVKLIPATAHLIRGTKGIRGIKGEKIVEVPTENLQKQDVVLVKPGEKIPTDGIVIEGESTVNESMITGESAPIGKNKGDKVIGGTINNDGSLTIEVTTTGKGTVISQIMELIRSSQQSKPNVQLLADKAANVLTLIAIGVGLGTFVFWFLVNPQGAIFAMTLAVSVVVVTCPHALGLAIPTVTTITSALGAKNGILIRDMKGLEIARKIDYVVFDKTGTLTRGEFGITDVIPSPSTVTLSEAKSLRVNSAKDLNKILRFTQNDILRLAAAVEIHSQHSIAKGIVKEAKAKGIKIPKVSNFKSYPGRGARGQVNGKEVVVSNKKLMEELGVQMVSGKGLVANGQGQMANKVGTVVYVAINKNLAGAIVLSDLIRDESYDAIKKLKQMGIKTAMLTGDKKDVADEVAKELKIDTVFAEVLPEDKVNKVKELQNKGHVVAMVGDGVNDAPSLTQAHMGIAIGAGTDVTVQSAEIVLMKNDPQDVVKAISLSLKTNAKMTQNLLWATGYNVIAIPAAAGLFYPSFGILLRPEWAAVLMSASSIIVVFNALLLRRTRLD